jgi:hypothetical protein
VFGHTGAKYVARAARFEAIARVFVRAAAVWNDIGVRVRTRVEKYDVTRQKYDVRALKYDVTAPKYDVRAPKYDVTARNYDVRAPKYDVGTLKYDVRVRKYAYRSPKYECRKPRYIVAPRSVTPETNAISCRRRIYLLTALVTSTPESSCARPQPKQVVPAII